MNNSLFFPSQSFFYESILITNKKKCSCMYMYVYLGSRAWQDNNNNSNLQIFKGSMDLVKGK